MTKDRAQVFIVDDSFPKLEEFVDREVFEKPIKKDDLLFLANNGQWSGEASLRQLIFDLLGHDHVKTEKIEVIGYNRPEICLSDLTNNRPDVIIYDWEYGDPFAQSSDWLFDLLGRTEAFIFVYSAVQASTIPPYLNKERFNEFAHRFQLFAKGEISNSVFTSEDFIYQYILSRVEKNNVIKIRDIEVKFQSNGYLETPSDILYLQSIFGRATLLELIRKHRNEISAESVEEMLQGIEGHLWFNPDKGFLISQDSPLIAKKFQANVEMSYLEALQRFGLPKLTEVVEVGFASTATI